MSAFVLMSHQMSHQMPSKCIHLLRILYQTRYYKERSIGVYSILLLILHSLVFLKGRTYFSCFLVVFYAFYLAYFLLKSYHINV